MSASDLREPDLLAFEPAMVTVGLALALSGARARESTRATLADAWACVRAAIDEAQPDSHARAVLRQALSLAVSDRAITSACAWSALDEARIALAAMDEQLDLDARALAAREHDEDDQDIVLRIARWIDATRLDEARLDRSVDALWSALDPPNSHRAARLLDVAARCENRARARLFLSLARRGVDVRGPLAADPALDEESRVASLSALRAHRATSALLWTEPASLAMARACADWSRYASHPRVLFFHYARHVGAQRWASELEAMQRWPLALEVREEWTRQRLQTPARVMARPIAAGAWACGRCDSRDVRAVRRWSDADEASDGDAVTTGEIEFQCPACHLRYWASWDDDTLSTAAPEPEAWVVA